MNKFKELSVLVVLMAVTFSINAQFHVGVKGGLNVSNVTGTNNYSAVVPALNINSLEYKPSFHGGLALQYMMQDFGVESGVYYSVLGGDKSRSQSSAEFEVKTDPAYIQVPLLFLYKFKTGRKTYFYPSAGVYFGYGVGGKIKCADYFGGEEKRYSESDYFDKKTNKFDIGTSVNLNFEYNKFVFGVGYDYGLKRVNKDSVKGEKNKHNTNFKASVGYLF